MDNNYDWLNIPENIKGIDYILIKNAKDKYLQIEELVKNIDNFINDYKSILKKDNDDNDEEFTRLVPPYNIKCSFNECIKKAAFKKNSDSKYYCWCHIYNQ